MLLIATAPWSKAGDTDTSAIVLFYCRHKNGSDFYREQLDSIDTMPKNTTGGNKAKGRANGVSVRATKNTRLIEDLFADMRIEDIVAGVHVGRVTRKFGNGRFEVFIVEQLATGPTSRTLNAPLAGRMRGKGKKDVWVDVDTLVILGSTDMGGSLEYEIIGMIPRERTRDLRTLRPDLDARIFATTSTAADDDCVIFEKNDDEDKEVNIDAI